MNAFRTIVATSTAILASTTGASWVAIDTVIAHADFAFRNDTLVVMDYDVIPDTVAYLGVRTVAGQSARLSLQAPAGAYYYDFDYADGHLWYQGLGTTNQYSLVHQTLDGKNRAVVGSSTKYRESIRAGGSRVVWIDYRNVTTRDPYNSEVYTALASGLAETRLTDDALYQAKARTNGTYAAWMEYDAARTKANIVLHDTRSGTSTKVAAGAWHQDDPWLSDSLLVWTDYRQNPSEADIWSYDLATREVRAVCSASGHQGKPVAQGKVVAWEDYRTGKSADIRAWSPSPAKEVEISLTPTHSTLPRLDGSRVAWYEENTVVAIAMAELGTTGGVVRAPSAPVGQLRRAPGGWSLDLPSSWSRTEDLRVRWRDARGAVLPASWTARGSRLDVLDAPASAMFLEMRAGDSRMVRLLPGAIR